MLPLKHLHINLEQLKKKTCKSSMFHLAFLFIKTHISVCHSISSQSWTFLAASRSPRCMYSPGRGWANALVSTQKAKTKKNKSKILKNKKQKAAFNEWPDIQCVSRRYHHDGDNDAMDQKTFGTITVPYIIMISWLGSQEWVNDCKCSNCVQNHSPLPIHYIGMLILQT